MLTVLFDAFMLFATVVALVGSFSARFTFGIVTGFARLLVGCAAIPIIFLSSFPGVDGPSRGVVVGSLAVAIGGPVLSFGTVFAAYWRARDVPAREEEAMRKPLMAWVPIAMMDGMSIFAAAALQAFLARD